MIQMINSEKWKSGRHLRQSFQCFCPRVVTDTGSSVYVYNMKWSVTDTQEAKSVT